MTDIIDNDGVLTGIRVFAVAGPKGDPGQKGDPGDPGEPGSDGVGISSIVFNADDTLTITLTNGNTYTSGSLRGAAGAAGQAGADGVGITSVVFNNDDTLTITLSNGNTYTSGSLRGPAGPAGPAGAAGAAATIAVGNVSTGSTPSVTNRGTSTAAIFDFVFPAGGGGGSAEIPTLHCTYANSVQQGTGAWTAPDAELESIETDGPKLIMIEWGGVADAQHLEALNSSINQYIDPAGGQNYDLSILVLNSAGDINYADDSRFSFFRDYATYTLAYFWQEILEEGGETYVYNNLRIIGMPDIPENTDTHDRLDVTGRTYFTTNAQRVGIYGMDVNSSGNRYTALYEGGTFSLMYPFLYSAVNVNLSDNSTLDGMYLMHPMAVVSHSNGQSIPGLGLGKMLYLVGEISGGKTTFNTYRTTTGTEYQYTCEPDDPDNTDKYYIPLGRVSSMTQGRNDTCTICFNPQPHCYYFDGEEMACEW